MNVMYVFMFVRIHFGVVLPACTASTACALGGGDGSGGGRGVGRGRVSG